MAGLGLKPRRASVSSTDGLIGYTHVDEQDEASVTSLLTKYFQRFKLAHRILLLVVLLPICFIGSGAFSALRDVQYHGVTVASSTDSRFGGGLSKLAGNRAKCLIDFGPWRPAAAYPAVPSGCAIDQISVLERAPSTYPDFILEESMRELARRIQTSLRKDRNRLQFLHNYSYTLNAEEHRDFAGEITPFGRLECVHPSQYKIAC